MAIQVLNAILLLSAGFIAGQYLSPTTPPHDAAPLSRKTAPQTMTEAAPTPLSARGPASVAGLKIEENRSSAPVDLAAYLLNFRIADVHEACSFARHHFLDQTVTAHARLVRGLDNFKEHENYLSALGRRLAEDEKFWVAKTELELENGKAVLEVVMDSHGFLPEADAEDSANCFRAHVRLQFANGHLFNTALDACTDDLVTKNRAYYLNWESFDDLEIGRQLTIVQIPLPESNGAEVEFMRSQGQTWTTGTGLRWEPLSLDQGLQRIDGMSPTMAQNRAD